MEISILRVYVTMIIQITVWMKFFKISKLSLTRWKTFTIKESKLCSLPLMGIRTGSYQIRPPISPSRPSMKIKLNLLPIEASLLSLSILSTTMMNQSATNNLHIMIWSFRIKTGKERSTKFKIIHRKFKLIKIWII